ncbi:hypothetical protein COB72_05305 [bacterium]|nr:MAG: hypothetical protein COB72_05305 [bacterium]
MPNHHQIQHHLVFSDLASASVNDLIELVGQEVHHAVRVKRVKENHTVGVLDGTGTTATATVHSIAGSRSKPALTLKITALDHHKPVFPAIEVFAALPKGDRLDRMIDQLSQLGVTKFRPLLCQRSQRKPETVRIDKLERIALEAAKQCHRPWVLNLDEPITFADAIKDPDAILADASGKQAVQYPSPARVVLLIGPEGGWSDEERDQINATKVPVMRFGLFVLRIEAAACAASAIVLSSISKQTP